MSQEPFSTWRIRITSANSHRWEYKENGTWTVFEAPPCEAIHLHQESVGYVFYDEEWLAQEGAGPTVPDLVIAGPPAANPFAGEEPTFPPAPTGSGSGAAAFRWNIVGAQSRYGGGFPLTTDDQVWVFTLFCGDVRVDPEMVILRPDPPPER